MTHPVRVRKGKTLTDERTLVDQRVFHSLVANAFEFLERSVTDFERSPRFSVVHFCAALEMLLKARLLKEHWSLIVAKPEMAKRQAFLDGAFISVTLEQSWDRLKTLSASG